MATTLFFAVGFAAVAAVASRAAVGGVAVVVAGCVDVIVADGVAAAGAVVVAGVVAAVVPVVAVVAAAGAATPDSLSSSFSPSESQSAKKRNALANPRTTSHIIHKSARSDAMINSMKRFQSIVTSSRIRYFYDMRTGASELRGASICAYRS